MISHVHVGIADFARAWRFYEAVLPLLGLKIRFSEPNKEHLRYTSRAKREADVSLSHRCTMEHPVAPWSTTMRRVLPPRDRR